MTELRKVTIMAILVIPPDSVFLESPTQAKGDPNFLLRSDQNRHFSHFLHFRPIPSFSRFRHFLTPSGPLSHLQACLLWCSGPGLIPAKVTESPESRKVTKVAFLLFLDFTGPG